MRWWKKFFLSIYSLEQIKYLLGTVLSFLQSKITFFLYWKTRVWFLSNRYRPLLVFVYIMIAYFLTSHFILWCFLLIFDNERNFATFSPARLLAGISLYIIVLIFGFPTDGRISYGRPTNVTMMAVSFVYFLVVSKVSSIICTMSSFMSLFLLLF